MFLHFTNDLTKELNVCRWLCPLFLVRKYKTFSNTFYSQKTFLEDSEILIIVNYSYIPINMNSD